MARRTTRGTVFTLVAILTLALLPPIVGGADVEVDELLQQMQRAMWPGEDMRSRFEVQVVSALGEHAYITGSYYRKGQTPDATLQRFVIESPLELRGFEVAGETRAGKPEHLQIYVPAVRRVRRLEIDMRKESFLGTDFNFEDLGFEDLTVSKHELKGAVERNGKSMYQVESVPERDWMYQKIVRYIDKDTHLPLETEYYCWGIGLCKVRKIEGVEQIDAYDSPAEITMEDLLTKQTTRLVVTKAEFNVGLSGDLFTCGGSAANCP